MEATRETETAAQRTNHSQDSLPQSSSSSTATKYLGKNLRITACANQGGRKCMEDRVHVHVQRCAVTGAVEWTYVAVYDGHGGPEASEYCRQHLLKNIQKMRGFNSENDDEFLEAIRSGFVRTHYVMLRERDNWPFRVSGHRSTAGTTTSCAFIRRGKLYVGHVGDSAILLTTRSHRGTFHRLTVAHKPGSPAERRRIEACGGHIMISSKNHARVAWTRAQRPEDDRMIGADTPVETVPRLAMTRSLGDFWSYVEETGEFAVSPIPDVSVTVLTPDHYSIVLASDGLTDEMEEEKMAIISSNLADDEKRMQGAVGEEERFPLNPNEHLNHARILVREAIRCFSELRRADNISVVSVVFDDDSNPSQSVEEEKDTVDSTTDSSDLPVELPKETSVDEQLAEHPLCMIRVTNERLERCQTAPVSMKYEGKLDDGFQAAGSIGPGFVSHDSERASMADLDEKQERHAYCLGLWYNSLRHDWSRVEKSVVNDEGVETDDNDENHSPSPPSTSNLTNVDGVEKENAASTEPDVKRAKRSAVDNASAEKPLDSSLDF